MKTPWTFPAGTVVFVGAGPGAPDLLTLRGRTAIEQADLVIYADSLVHPDIVGCTAPSARVVGSAGLTLESIADAMIDGARRGQRVARVHSGDPSIYGAIHEQMRRLDEAGIAYQVVPGVSSALASAAAFGTELTIPDLAQSVVFTRVASRTSGPSIEHLGDFVPRSVTLVLFLSINVIERVVRELMTAGWPAETPAAVAHRVTWPDELLLRGTLADIAAKSREARLSKHALILVGDALDSSEAGRSRALRSSLYHPGFSHGRRIAADRGAISGIGARRSGRDA